MDIRIPNKKSADQLIGSLRVSNAAVATLDKNACL